MSYCRVGAHHQNGVAERGLQTITRWALAMMMHQLVHWPEYFDPALWPFALDHAVHIWNNLPKERGGLTPNELFAGIKEPQNDAILRSRVWGCPVYVLDPKLQDGKKLPKWKPRSRLGMYLGISPTHSTTVGRVLNLETGYISPQYHLVFDELFHTVSGGLRDEVFDADLWNTLLTRDGLEKVDDRTDVNGEAIPFDDNFEEFNQRDPDPEPGPFIPVPEGDEDSDSDTDSEPNGTSIPEGAPGNEGGPEPYVTRSGRRVRRPTPLHTANFAGHVPKQSQPRHKPAHEQMRYQAGGNPRSKVKQKDLHKQYMASLDWSQAVNLLKTGDGKRTMLEMFKDYDFESETQESWSPLALAAKTTDADADTFTFQEAMNHPESDGFWQAAKKELETLTKTMDVWDEVDREPWMNVLPSTWAFRIKRFPNGLIRKFKARFCARGDKQIHGVDFFDTYAPVVSWTTVRLLLILSLELELATRQVDYTAAFVHADVEKPPDFDKMSPEEQAKTGVYVEMPRGFSKPGKVLKLKKALYGLRSSPRSFYLYLRDILEEGGLKCQEDVDPCLFISDKVICLLYVDDTLLYAKRDEDIDEVLAYLRKRGLTLEEEDDVAGFLGVDIKRNPQTGEITMTQTGLIDRILEAMEIGDLDPVGTPADDVLGKDEFGDPADCSFNYASVIGMLWYLYGHSRPDLGFAVSQAARFAFAPKRSHELALIRIGQYLKGTWDKGLTFKPVPMDQEFTMDVYVDSDFMGLYGKEQRSDPSNVKSRTGYVICLNGCPVIWSSKLQDGIALSTMMAEYYALSSAMREVIPLRSLVQTVAKGCGVDEHVLTTFKTTVWEDNNGALTLANLDPGQQTPRSKFYDVKVHWFRSHLKPNNIEVKKIDTKIQLADLFTKPLTKDTFSSLRKLLMGW